jgi:hypothetical protein
MRQADVGGRIGHSRLFTRVRARELRGYMEIASNASACVRLAAMTTNVTEDDRNAHA